MSVAEFTPGLLGPLYKTPDDTRYTNVTRAVTDDRGEFRITAAVLTGRIVDADREISNTDFFAATVSDQNGSFSFPSSRPGDYWVLAGDYTMADVILKPKLLSEVLPRATRVSLQKGSSPVIVVRVAPR